MDEGELRSLAGLWGYLSDVVRNVEIGLIIWGLDENESRRVVHPAVIGGAVQPVGENAGGPLLAHGVIICSSDIVRHHISVGIWLIQLHAVLGSGDIY